MSILIKDTTPMECIQIVKDALEGEYDEFYDDYVSGNRKLAGGGAGVSEANGVPTKVGCQAARSRHYKNEKRMTFKSIWTF